ncbi:MAG: PD-(D/E)XK nuclease domain-containing protein, partial [Myxococcota bacterium]
ESGKGRPDLLLLPRDARKPGIVMEFKVVEAEDRLEQAAQAGLAQILQKDYTAEFADRPCSFILAVGMAFFGKKLAVAHERV